MYMGVYRMVKEQNRTEGLFPYNNKDLLTRVLIRYTSIFHKALNTT